MGIRHYDLRKIDQPNTGENRGKPACAQSARARGRPMYSVPCAQNPKQPQIPKGNEPHADSIGDSRLQKMCTQSSGTIQLMGNIRRQRYDQDTIRRRSRSDQYDQDTIRIRSRYDRVRCTNHSLRHNHVRVKQVVRQLHRYRIGKEKTVARYPNQQTDQSRSERERAMSACARQRWQHRCRAPQKEGATIVRSALSDMIRSAEPRVGCRVIKQIRSMLARASVVWIRSPEK